MERPDPVEPKASFNPEAATFNPAEISAQPTDKRAITARSVGTVSPGSMVTALTHHSPSLSPRNVRPTNFEKSQSTWNPLRLTDVISSGKSLSTLLKTIEENPAISAQDWMKSLQPENTFYGRATSSKIPLAPTYGPVAFQHEVPHLNVVDVDELNTRLGLPGARKDKESPTKSIESRASPGFQDKLFSKLIDEARGHPLTANDLARHMTNQMDPSDQTIKGLYAPQNPRIGEFMPGQDLGPALRATRPTLGFGSQASRIARAKGEYMYAGPSTAQTNPFSSAPYDTFQYQRLGSGQPSTTYPYQERRPSNRSRPRGQMRKKRTDQGPEPSVADIYPDDAHWAPTQPIHRGYFAPPPPVPLRPQPILYAERPAQWPTPAEVYTQGRQLPRQAPVAQVFNIFEGHYAPTEEDISDADGDVVALIDQLPNPSVHTLMCFSQASLTPDARPLTPEQEIGERYGLTCQGAGSGEAWSPPAVPGTELFSARW